MKVGFIGAGVVAQTISKHVLALGHRVLLSNTRGPESLAPLVKELGSGAEAGTPQQATEQDIVVLAANWPNVQKAMFSGNSGQGNSGHTKLPPHISKSVRSAKCCSSPRGNRKFQTDSSAPCETPAAIQCWAPARRLSSPGLVRTLPMSPCQLFSLQKRARRNDPNSLKGMQCKQVRITGHNASRLAAYSERRNLSSFGSRQAVICTSISIHCASRVRTARKRRMSSSSI